MFGPREVYQIPAVLFSDLAAEGRHNEAEAGADHVEEEEISVEGDVKLEVGWWDRQRIGQGAVAAAGEAVTLSAVLCGKLASAVDRGLSRLPVPGAPWRIRTGVLLLP